MKPTNQQLWERFQKYYREFPSIELSLDISRMNFPDDFFERMERKMAGAFQAMKELEDGGIANLDEKRMVGHYWLRAPEIAPSEAIRKQIESTVARIKEFANQVHSSQLKGSENPFKSLLVIGIGGSALGPQFVSAALGHPETDKMAVYFFDNTDPDGMDVTLASIPDLAETLCVVISKSGGTKETRNGMLEAKAAFEKAGLNFAKHAVAVTGEGSELDKVASQESWLERFPMWDWVGGRTSELSAVGLLPAALQGIDITQMLEGAKACDALTRESQTMQNPAAILALMWHHAGDGRGRKDMVVLPYKDRLALFSKYLQQLIMESLGKERDIGGKIVNQGIAVYGNKGATDQHSYIQQLRDGVNNFFATFIEVLQDRKGPSLEVEEGTTAGDYLQGFFLGTRQALHENGRESLTITVQAVSAFSVGVLIALFERVVGLYASLIGINAYHQPGVEAGKKAAASVIDIQRKIVDALKAQRPSAASVSELAGLIGASGSEETVFKICQHLAANPERGIHRSESGSPVEVRYKFG